MANSTFNTKLDTMITEAVQYFQTHYITKYREHTKNVQSPEFNGNTLGNIHIYSHVDSDGLCAASILSMALKRENISFHVTILKQLEEKYMSEIAFTMRENHEFLFFLDYGSGQLNILSEYLENPSYIILDHHQPLRIDESQKVMGFHVNPYFADINGSSEISGSGMCYLFAKKLRKDNIDLSALAIIGAIGDHQNSGNRQSFIGENSAILQDAINSHQIVQEEVLLLPREVSLPLGLAKYLPEEINLFKDDIKQSSYFLEKIGIKYVDEFGHPRFPSDLSTIEKTKLISSLVEKLVAGNPENAKYMSSLLTNRYLLPQFKQYPEIYHANDFSTMINACGRLNVPSIGIACCVTRSNDIILKGIEQRKIYSKQLQDGIKWLVNGKKFSRLHAIEAFDGEDRISELTVGVICTILIDNPEYDDSPAFNNKKVIVGYAYSDQNNYKISARCTEDLIIKGVDLSQAIRKTSTDLGLKVKGGGHPPAAGAFIPKELIQKFLLELDQQVSIQLGDEIASKPLKKTNEKTGQKTVKKTIKKATKKSVIKNLDDIQESEEKNSGKKSKGLDQFWG